MRRKPAQSRKHRDTYYNQEPDPNRPLTLCEECGKYTESLMAHYMGDRCRKVKNYKGAA